MGVVWAGFYLHCSGFTETAGGKVCEWVWFGRGFTHTVRDELRLLVERYGDVSIDEWVGVVWAGLSHYRM